MIELTVNGQTHNLDVPDEMPLLWVLRDVLNLTGTKFGCGAAQCGCCTVHIAGEAQRSCVTPVGTVKGKSIVTIEALSPDGTHPVQAAWVAGNVPQCGYCQPGQIMTAAALLAKNSNPSTDDVLTAMTNICRCGTYDRIRNAIARAKTSS
jgi:isoquinoline 1-oxidoreductase subunit alpha